MKKVILSIVVISMIAVLGLGLSACNNATPQGTMANILADHSHEQFVYDVYDSALESSIGEYTVTLDAYASGSTVTFGEGDLTNVAKGIRVLGVLDVIKDGVRYVYETGCYYSLIGKAGYMTPLHTYRKQVEDDVQVFSVSGYYNSNGLVYTKKVGTEEPSNGAIKVSGSVMDNNQFQQCLRSVTMFAKGFSLTFSTPVVTAETADVATLTAASVSADKVKTAYTNDVEAYAENGISCYKISVTRSTPVIGSSMQLWYAKDSVTYNNWDLTTVLVKFVEPYKLDGTSYEMVYSLKSVAL